MDKVLIDWGIRAKPEGYVTASDKVFKRLPAVGQAELKRLNIENRRGEVKFQDEGGLQGKYYKEVKIYERFHPLEATVLPKGPEGSRGFVGYIEYSCRIYQGTRKATRAEVVAEDASIATDVTSREVYRYKFGPTGTWDSGKGELVTR
jgi:hypothetical protein